MTKKRRIVNAIAETYFESIDEIFICSILSKTLIQHLGRDFTNGHTKENHDLIKFNTACSEILVSF